MPHLLRAHGPGSEAAQEELSRALLPEPETPYRWVILATSWTIFVVASGLVFFALPVYMAELVVDPGIPIGEVSTATSFFYVALAVIGLPVARLITRVDARWVMAGGATVGAAGFLVLGGIDRLWQVYLAYGLLGTSFAALTFIPLTTLVFRWFVQRRGFAMTFLMCGQAVGGGLVTPFVASLLKRQGLASAGPWLALGYVCVILVLTLAFIRPSPAPGRATVHRTDALVVPARQLNPVSEPVAQTASSRFALVCFAMSLVPCAAIGVMTHLYTLGAERQIGGRDSMVPLVAIASGVGTFLVLPLLAGRSATAVTAIIAALQAGAVLLLAAAFSTVPFALGSLALGLGLGAFIVLMPLVLLDLYPVSQYPRLYALLTLFVNLGVAAGPGTLGLLRSLVTGYRLPLVAMAAAPVVATCLLSGLAWMRRAQHQLNQQGRPDGGRSKDEDR